MLRNYLAAALRNLTRNKLHASINIAGLALGFAASILIGLFVRDELSYDRWIAGHERTYLVSEIIELHGARPLVVAASPAELAGWLRQDYPQIEAVARLVPKRASLRRDEREYSEELWWADPEFFKVLPVPALAGNPESALHRSNAVVLTRSMAQKYFGSDDPIGQQLEIDREHVMSVAAVIEDLPSNTHLDIGIVAAARASFSPLSRADALPPPLASGNNAAPGFTYLRLKPGASIESLRNDTAGFLARHVPPSSILKVTFPITAIADLHLHPPVLDPLRSPTLRSAASVTLYAAIALAFLIVLVSSVNFVNLMTARASRRAVEVGIRKASGAGRRELIVQFIGECLVHAAIAATIAVALAEAVMPAFNGFLDRRIAFDYWRDPALIGGVVGLAGVVGILAGAYPAFALARLHPAAVFGGDAPGIEGSRFIRQSLVVLQFAVLIGLILAAAIVRQQSRYALHKSLSSGNDPILVIATSCTESFRQAVSALPGVLDTACSRSLPGEPTDQQLYAVPAGRTRVALWHTSIDAGFLELYGLRPVAGRFFDRTRVSDLISTSPAGSRRQSILVNEAAVKALGFSSPQAAVHQIVSCIPLIRGIAAPGFQPCEIIGVAPDYAEGSIREPIPPYLYYFAPDDFLYLSARLDGRNILQAVASMERLWKRLGEPRAMSHFFLDQLLERTYRDIIRQSQAVAAFAGVASIIACLGLFGLSAFLVEKRTREIGVRKALGADGLAVLRKLSWDFIRPVLWGSCIALPVTAYCMSLWLEGFAYRIDLHPATFFAAVAAALLIALLTVSAHTVALARTRPVEALRHAQ